MSAPPVHRTRVLVLRHHLRVGFVVVFQSVCSCGWKGPDADSSYEGRKLCLAHEEEMGPPGPC